MTLVRKKILSIYALLIGLSGCTESSTQLRTSPGETGTFSVQLPVNVAVSNFMVIAAECYIASSSDKTLTLTRDELESNRRDTVELVSNYFAHKAILSVDFQANTKDTTSVTYYSIKTYNISSLASGGIRDRMIKFVNGDYDHCYIY